VCRVLHGELVIESVEVRLEFLTLTGTFRPKIAS
jgi:hypothetical protein